MFLPEAEAFMPDYSDYEEFVKFFYQNIPEEGDERETDDIQW